MKKTVVCQLMLGNTRVIGYTLYDHETMAFEETTPKQTSELIANGVVNGLVLGDANTICLDREGFCCTNLMVKSAVGNYRLLLPSSRLFGQSLFALTKVIHTDTDTIYEVVSHLCARLPLSEDKVRALLKLGCLCGCKLNPADENEIVVCSGVDLVDLTKT